MLNFSMQQKAFELANRWINRNYKVYQANHKLWQQYDVAKDYVRSATDDDYTNEVLIFLISIIIVHFAFHF